MTSDLVEIDGLSIGYAGRASLAVREVSMSIGAGHFHGLVGESGSGKSTIARSVLGLSSRGELVHGGRVLLQGTDLARITRRQLRQMRGARVGYIGQNPVGALHPVLRIERQFELVRQAHPGLLGRDAGHARARILLDQVGIANPDSILRGYGHQLSGGMAQRIVIALAMYLEPELIVADEPTTGLDVTVQRQILDMLTAAATERGMSLLLVTHDLGVVAQYCETVTVLYGGRVMEAGPVDRVLVEPAHPYTRSLVASVPVRGRPLPAAQASSHPIVDDGCPFRLRCPIAAAECRLRPPRVSVGAGWHANCHALEVEAA